MKVRCWVLLYSLFVSFAANSAEPASLAAKDAETFFDAIWLTQENRDKLLGAVVTVVENGKVVLNKGYGYGDYLEQQAIDPETSLFRIASISKPFTWIAVLQLVEQGKLDLDEDVNLYIDAFQIPAPFGKPVTMKHLMTHTAGFEDVVLDLGRSTPDELLPLGEYLADNLPRQVRPPGTQFSYSNHSTAIAAHVVEAVSGQDWSSYLEQNILEPLGMTYTVVRHPMPEHLQNDRVKAYRPGQGTWHEEEFLYWFIYPAGMISTSGGDMARLMTSLLGVGQQVLGEQARALLFETAFTPFPGANGWTHGLSVYRQSPRVMGHGGDLNGFHSELILIPELNTGVFVSFNTDGGAALSFPAGQAFVEHMLPIDRGIPITPPEGSQVRHQAVEGTYAPLRRSHSSFAKLALLMSTTEVRFNDEGYLLVGSGNRTSRYSEVGEFLFQSVKDQHAKIYFERDDSGQVTHMHSSKFAGASREKLALTDEPTLHKALFALVAAVSLICFVAWPLIWWQGKAESGVVAFEFMAWAAALVTLATIVSLVVNLSDQQQFVFEIPVGIERLLAAILLLAGFTLPLAFACYRFARHGGVSVRRALPLYAMTATLLLYTGMNYYWNTLLYYL